MRAAPFSIGMRCLVKQFWISGKFWISERGSVADEYALLVTMIILIGAAGLHVADVPLSSLGDFVSNTFQGAAVLLDRLPDERN